MSEFRVIQQNAFPYRKRRSWSSREAAELTCDCRCDPRATAAANGDGNDGNGAESDMNGKTNCGERCVNRLLKIECSPKHCPCGTHCRNQRFARRQYAALSIRKFDGKGWGLVAKEALKKGQLVIEYLGEVVPTEELQPRLQQYATETPHHYFMALSATEVLDATRKANVGRFINHSCEANCATERWTANGEPVVGIFTKRDVAAGTELTFDYQYERYGKQQQACHCGAPTCRGFIGTSHDKKLRVGEARH